MGVSYSKLVEKFIDKGYIYELHLFIGTPPPFIPGRAIADSIEKEREIYSRIIQEVYGEEWDYWNAWIDHQTHKF